MTGVYGIRSEMVAPVIHNDDLIGWVSVHNTRGPHQWTKGEIAAIEAACVEVGRHIDALEIGKIRVSISGAASRAWRQSEFIVALIAASLAVATLALVPYQVPGEMLAAIGNLGILPPSSRSSREASWAFVPYCSP